MWLHSSWFIRSVGWPGMCVNRNVLYAYGGQVLPLLALLRRGMWEVLLVPTFLCQPSSGKEPSRINSTWKGGSVHISSFFCSTPFAFKRKYEFSILFKTYFVLEYSHLTMLWQFQVNSKGTQSYTFTYPFSPKFPSHPGCHIILSRVLQWTFGNGKWTGSSPLKHR